VVNSCYFRSLCQGGVWEQDKNKTQLRQGCYAKPSEDGMCCLWLRASLDIYEPTGRGLPAKQSKNEVIEVLAEGLMALG